MKKDQQLVEFTRLIDAKHVREAGAVAVEIVAAPDERAALARRLGVQSLEALSAQLTVKPWRGDGISVSGELRAEVTQACVVTLEPVAARLTESVSARLAPAAGGEPASEVIDLHDPDAADPPEPLGPGDTADLGELVVQHLAVAIDPYPRKAGVTYNEPDGSGDQPAEHPFAVLARLKGRTGP